MPPPALQQQRHPIPLAYRIVLCAVEPLLALSGSLLLVASPSTYLDFVSSPRPRVEPPAAAAASADTRILADQLAALMVVGAVLLAVLLPRSRDVATWRSVCGAMLFSDALHVAANVRDRRHGAAAWSAENWANVLLLVGMAAVRLAVVAGVGIGNKPGEAEARPEAKIKTP